MRAVFKIVIFAFILGLFASLVPVRPRPKIQAKMTISELARIFYLIFAWNPLVLPQIKQGCVVLLVNFSEQPVKVRVLVHELKLHGPST